MTQRIDLGHLAVDLGRPRVELKLKQVAADEHQLVRRAGEVGGGHDGPFDLGRRAAAELHGDAERLIHPRLGLARTQRGLDEGDHVVVLAGLHLRPRVEAHLGRIVNLRAEVAVPEHVGRDRGVGRDRCEFFRGLGRLGDRLVDHGPGGRLTLGEHEVACGLVDGLIGHAELAAATAAEAAATATEAAAATAEAAATAAEATALAAAAEAATTAAKAAAAGDDRLLADHKVADGIDLGDKPRLGFFLGRDQQHLIGDDIRQLKLLQHEPQRGAERDVAVRRVDRLVRADAQVVERRRVQLDVDLVLVPKELDNFFPAAFR